MIVIVIFTVFLSGMLGVSIGYHRYLAHKSFSAVRWFQILIVFLGLPAGTPIQWVGNHRAHHLYADTSKDPHSPHFGGFWWAHTGWYINSRNRPLCFMYAIAGPFRTFFDAFYRPRTNQQYNKLAKDISADPVFTWMSRKWNYTVLVFLHTGGALTIVAILWGIKGLVLTYFCYVYVYNMGDAVDSIGHLWGKRKLNSKHRATNNLFLGPLAFGDGWHANHHDHPVRARHGIGKQLDPSFLFLKQLSCIKIVSNLKG